MKHEQIKIHVCDLHFFDVFIIFINNRRDSLVVYFLMLLRTKSREFLNFFLCDLDKLLLGKALAGEESPVFMSQEVGAPS